MKTIKLNIVKKNRVYFKCINDKGYEVKLKITPDSENLTIGEHILNVRDVSVRTKYGTDIIFELITQDALNKKKALKYLLYAEAAVSDGSYKRNCIFEAIELCAKYDDLKERIEKVKEEAEKNKKYYDDLKTKEREEREIVKEKIKSKRMLFALSYSPPLGVPTEMGWGIVVFESSGATFRINENHPSVFGSHLLGYEGEYGAYFYYRDATQDEIQELNELKEKEEIKRKEEKKLNKEIQELKNFIQENGELPSQVEQNEISNGDTILDNTNIYGGGDKFVITKNKVWYIQGNGGDGDNWTNNNLPGQIGWCINKTPEIENKVKQLQ